MSFRLIDFARGHQYSATFCQNHRWLLTEVINWYYSHFLRFVPVSEAWIHEVWRKIYSYIELWDWDSEIIGESDMALFQVLLNSLVLDWLINHFCHSSRHQRTVFDHFNSSFECLCSIRSYPILNPTPLFYSHFIIHFKKLLHEFFMLEFLQVRI